MFVSTPDSFFFAGEPGGYLGLKVDSIDHPKPTMANSWVLTKGGIGDAQWREELVMHWTRVPTAGVEVQLGSGKLELERSSPPEQPEPIVTRLGTYKTEKLGLITTGREPLDQPLAPQDTPAELPATWVSP